MKTTAKRLLQAAARTSLGTRILRAAAVEEPPISCEHLFIHLNEQSRFDTVSTWPIHLNGFEDLTFLFSSNHLNVGIAILAFDEAAYLYKLTRALSHASIVEIGRFKGGSTFVFAAAMDETSQLYSYDWVSGPSVPSPKSDGTCRYPAQGTAKLDQMLHDALVRYGLEQRVHLLIADSGTVTPTQETYDLVFVDGDHTYEGVATDFHNWAPRILVGGHLLFHDANPRDFAPSAVGVTKLVREIEAQHSSYFIKQADVGSLAHFVCIQRIKDPKN